MPASLPPEDEIARLRVEKDQGASPTGSGSRPSDQAPAGLAPSGFDPSRDPTGWSVISRKAREASGLTQDELAETYNTWIDSLGHENSVPHQFKAFLAGVALVRDAPCDPSSAVIAELIEVGRRCAEATFYLGMAQAHARPERLHQNDATEEEFAEAEKELSSAQEEKDEALCALISVYANADGYPMTREELAARLAPGIKARQGGDNSVGSVEDESPARREAPISDSLQTQSGREGGEKTPRDGTPAEIG